VDTHGDREKPILRFARIQNVTAHIGTQRGKMKTPKYLKEYNDALRFGKLVRPQTCSQCGIVSTGIHGHHHDYSKPLDVIWVCRKCHRHIHKNSNITAPKSKIMFSNYDGLISSREIEPIRISLNISREHFAKKMKVSVTTVSRWEKGERVPSHLYMDEIQKYFNRVRGRKLTMAIN
jgi:ribosome-binding protein aMBF1 (putative translation factor)